MFSISNSLVLYILILAVVGSGQFAKLRLSHGYNSPSSEPGTFMVCERVHIHGLSRTKDLTEFAHSVLVKVTGRDSSVYMPKAEVCFHW